MQRNALFFSKTTENELLRLISHGFTHNWFQRQREEGKRPNAQRGRALHKDVPRETPMFNQYYDVIVVGGAAGAVAAAAAANMGSKTLLITMNLQHIAQMSCNPAMEVLPKGK